MEFWYSHGGDYKKENHVGYDAVDSGRNSPNSREIVLHLYSVSRSDNGEVRSSEMSIQFYDNGRCHVWKDGNPRTTPPVVRLYPRNKKHNNFFSDSYRASWYYQSFIYSATDTLVSCLKKNNIKIYITIYIKTAPTCFGVTVTPSSGSALICVY